MYAHNSLYEVSLETGERHYRRPKTGGEDSEYDTRKALRKLRQHVESNRNGIQEQAEIMVDHFHEQVWQAENWGPSPRYGGPWQHQLGDSILMKYWFTRAKQLR